MNRVKLSYTFEALAMLLGINPEADIDVVTLSIDDCRRIVDIYLASPQFAEVAEGQEPPEVNAVYGDAKRTNDASEYDNSLDAGSGFDYDG